MHILLFILLLASAASVTPSRSAHSRNTVCWHTPGSAKSGPHLQRRAKVGDQIGNWRLGQSVGKGPINTAYHAESVKRRRLTFLSKRQVAVLKLGPKYPWEQTSETAMHHEARMHQRASKYPSVAKFIEFIPEVDGEEGIVMEYVKGKDVRVETSAEHNGRLFTEDEARRLFLPIIQTLSEMHTKLGLVHRDIKPENLIVDRARTSLKLIDFDYAVLLKSQQPEDKAFDPTTVACGTNGFIAPEVVFFKATKENLPKADVYSVTATILDAVFGGVKTNSHGFIHFVLPPGANPSPELLNLLTQGMELDVEKRLSMQELANHPFFKSKSPLGKVSNAISNAISKVSSFRRKLFARKKPSNP